MFKSCSHFAACALAALAFHSNVGFAQHVEGGIDIGDITYGPPPTEEYTPPPTQPQGTGESEAGVDFGINVGLLVSPGYQNMLEDSNPDAEVAGVGAWLGFGLGLNVHPSSTISFAADLDMLFSFVSTTASSGGSSDFYANVMLIPSLSFRHTVTRPTSFFWGLEFNSSLPNTSDSDVDLESRGAGTGFLLGVAFPSQGYLELNIRNLPVRASAASNPSAHEDYNFGGVTIKFRKSF